jgi:hypothetical protein
MEKIMNTPYTATHVFYSAEKNCIIDTCTDENPPRSHIYGNTLPEIRQRYPDAVMMNLDNACTIMDEKNRLPVSETTEAEFWEMLETLPPAGWKRDATGESFKMSELYSGNITSIYACIKGHYFTLRDDIRTPHAEIIARCKSFTN